MILRLAPRRLPPRFLPFLFSRSSSFQPYRLIPFSLDTTTLSPTDAKKFAANQSTTSDRQSASPPNFPAAAPHRLPSSPSSLTISPSRIQAAAQSEQLLKALTVPTSAEQQLSEPAKETIVATISAPLSNSAKPKRKSRLRTPRKAAITLTVRAVKQLRDLLDQPEPKLIRVGVKNRGCSGLSYHLEYVDKPGPFDEKVEQDGVMVLIDSKALFSIIGSEMDWQEDELVEKFVFKNPNIKDQCGCGESFSV